MLYRYFIFILFIALLLFLLILIKHGILEVLTPLVKEAPPDIQKLTREALMKIYLHHSNEHYSAWWKLAMEASGIQLLIQSIKEAKNDIAFSAATSSLSTLLGSANPFQSSVELGKLLIFSGVVDYLLAQV